MIDTLLNRMREQAFLNAGVRLVIVDACGEERIETDFAEGGIRSFVSYLNSQRHSEVIHNDVIYMYGEKDGSIAEIAIQYNNSYNETILTFANNMNTIEGGMHETGFKAALTKVLNDYAHKTGLLKENDKNLSGEDVREGICAIVSVKLENAQFESAKAKLGNLDRTLVEPPSTPSLPNISRKTRQAPRQ